MKRGALLFIAGILLFYGCNDDYITDPEVNDSYKFKLVKQLNAGLVTLGEYELVYHNPVKLSKALKVTMDLNARLKISAESVFPNNDNSFICVYVEHGKYSNGREKIAVIPLNGEYSTSTYYQNADLYFFMLNGLGKPAKGNVKITLETNEGNKQVFFTPENYTLNISPNLRIDYSFFHNYEESVGHFIGFEEKLPADPYVPVLIRSLESGWAGTVIPELGGIQFNRIWKNASFNFYMIDKGN